MSDGASDVRLMRLQQTTILVETTVLVEYKGLTIFSTKRVGCCTVYICNVVLRWLKFNDRKLKINLFVVFVTE